MPPKTRTRTKSSVNGNDRSLIERPVDALGDVAEAETIADFLTLQARKRKEVETEMLYNGMSAEDAIPGLPPGPDGEVIYYGARLKAYDEAEARVREANEHIWPQIEQVFKAKQARQRAMLEAQAETE